MEGKRIFQGLGGDLPEVGMMAIAIGPQNTLRVSGTMMPSGISTPRTE